ncbi:MAG: phosphate ABC transporter permease PstA, partial [Mariprofundus sp.]
EQRFRAMCFGAVVFALLFLVFFFADLISKGWPALQQAEIQIEVNYSEAVRDGKYRLAVDKQFRKIISRGWLRTLPLHLEDHPKLVGTTASKWVVAIAEVDQYLKGHPNKLKLKYKKLVDELQTEGKIHLAFNTYFFTRGDSKMPELAGIRSAVVGTIYVLLLTMLFSLPIGIMTAVYLEEFAPDNRFIRFIEVNINNLAAIPSILFGLLGLAIFINFFGVPRSSALVGGLTLSLMTLPVIIISARVALEAVPDSIREAALGVGASHWQTVWHHVLPLAMPGILTGSIIGLARAMGETAPLIIVGMIAYIPDAPSSILEAATVLPAQIYTWTGEPLRAFAERTSAAILVLLAVLLGLNAVAIWFRQRFEHKW